MAHEVNNPLGGLFNALDTLRRHGADPSVRESTLSLLHRGLWQIRKVVRSTIVTYRPEGFSYGLAPADVLAEAMAFVDHGATDLERLESNEEEP